MPAPKEYDAETQERAVRMYGDRILEHGGSNVAARRHVGELLDIAPATPAELDRTGGDPPGPRNTVCNT